MPKPLSLVRNLLLPHLQTLLGSDLVGLYLRGSLANGDFEPDRSDIDLLAVIEKPLDDRTFTALSDLHAAISQSDHPFANRLEIAYIDRPALRRWQPGQRHPTLGQGEALSWQQHGSNWLFERWLLRNQDSDTRILVGPDPKTLIDPIPPQALKTAAAARLQDWADWARDESDPDWDLPRSHKAYTIETICRVLYTISHSSLVNKRDAITWALNALPDPWRDLVKRSRAWRLDSAPDPSLNPEVRAFILWAENRQVGEAKGESGGS